MEETYGLKEISTVYIKSISQYPISRIIYDLLKDPLLTFHIKRLVLFLKQNPNIVFFRGSPLSKYVIDRTASNTCIVYDLMQWGDDLMFRVIACLISHIFAMNYRETVDIDELHSGFYSIELTTIGEITNVDLNKTINDIAGEILMYRDQYHEELKRKGEKQDYVAIDFYDKIVVYVNKNDIFSLNNLYIRGEGVLDEKYIQVGSDTYYELILRLRESMSIPFIENIFDSIIGTCNSYTYILPFKNKSNTYPLEVKKTSIEQFVSLSKPLIPT